LVSTPTNDDAEEEELCKIGHCRTIACPALPPTREIYIHISMQQSQLLALRYVHFSLKQKGKERVNWDALRIFQFILVIPVLSVYIVQPSLNVNHLLPLMVDFFDFLEIAF
jgi:hypothetical protein